MSSYLRVRDIFSDDIPKLCICFHQLRFAEIKNDSLVRKITIGSGSRVMHKHTKNWKPLSVNRGASFSLHKQQKKSISDLRYHILNILPCIQRKERFLHLKTFDSKVLAGKFSS